jgi:hypothetical protein
MSYLKYEHDIVTKYKVELVGWPLTIKFASPSEIGTVDEICRLHQALKIRDCKGVAQTQRQQQAHLEMLAMQEAAGESVGKKRKQRSDKGKTRKKKTAGEKAGVGQHNDDNMGGEHTNEDEPTHQIKKHKIATAARKLPPAAKSWPFINDRSDDDSSVDNA